MIKLKQLIFENSSLIFSKPPEEREKLIAAEHYRTIQKYINSGCKGVLDLETSPIKILPDNLTHINGDLYLDESKIENLNNLERVSGNLRLYKCKTLKSLGKLNYVGEALNLDYTNIQSFENLKYIGDDLSIHDSKILDVMTEDEIRKLVKIKGSIFKTD